MSRAIVLAGLLGLAACAGDHQPPKCSGPSLVLNGPAVGTGENDIRPTPGPASPIAPADVSDNGEVTAFLFPNNQFIPKILYVSPDGTETIAPYTVHGDYIVVPMIAPEWHLRLGKAVVCLRNPHYSPIGVNPHTGTTSPDVLLDRGHA